MIGVLIADDEYWIREGLKTTIDWEKYGFYIVGDAADAEEAYELYQKLRPQLIISDIRMEKTNGLDLVSRIHNENADTEFIILSGYQQFDYAKRAFENGTFAYLLKPIEADKLIETIEGVRDKIHEKRRIKESLAMMEMQLPALKSIFYNDFMNGGEEFLKGKTQRYNIDEVGGSFVICAIENDKNNDEVCATVQLFSDAHEKICDFWFDGERYYLIINANEEEISKFALKNMLLELNDAIKDITAVDSVLGISSVIRSRENMKQGFDEANEVLGNHHEGKILHYYTPGRVKKEASFSYSDVERLITAINDVDYAEAKRIIDKVFSAESDGVNVGEVKNLASEMMIITLFSVFKNKHVLDEIFGKGFNVHKTISEYGTAEEVHDGVIRLINKIFENPNVFLKCGYNPKIQQAVSIIMMYYSEPLSVESVARELDISASYLMMLFKQELGTTFNSYLTEYRIKTAIKLMKKNEYKIYEISEMVGYKDSDYFTRIFKKVTGVTPKKYMKG